MFAYLFFIIETHSFYRFLDAFVDDGRGECAEDEELEGGDASEGEGDPDEDVEEGEEEEEEEGEDGGMEEKNAEGSTFSKRRSSNSN